jgi:flagellar biosynthesis protein
MKSSIKKTPVKEAVALRFDPDNDNAPRVVAAGSGAVADRITEAATAGDVPIHMDPELAHMLNEFRVGQEIPPELYTVVAQILLFVSRMDEEFLTAN